MASAAACELQCRWRCCCLAMAKITALPIFYLKLYTLDYSCVFLFMCSRAYLIRLYSWVFVGIHVVVCNFYLSLRAQSIMHVFVRIHCLSCYSCVFICICSNACNFDSSNIIKCLVWEPTSTQAFQVTELLEKIHKNTHASMYTRGYVYMYACVQSCMNVYMLLSERSD